MRKRNVDVVVVGGGAAGCVVAARLAESPGRSVLLFEAGPDPRAKMPLDFLDGWRIAPGFDWGYASEPNERGVAEDLRRGKLLGGTSWLTRFAVRGSPSDFDEWGALGIPGWTFGDVLPYFRRIEDDADFGDQPWHGDEGPIPIDRYLNVEPSEIGAAAIAAMEATGFPHVDDHNRPGAAGVGRMPMSSRNGRRVASADAYLPLGQTSPNLEIRADTHVAEVMFEGMRATGVRLSDGSIIEGGWVVLCAGTYTSPAILMRSGIGPAEHLRSVDVPVRLELPGVGANLADHPSVDLELEYRGPVKESQFLHSIATFHSGSAKSNEAPDLMLWVADPRDPGGFEIDIILLKPRSRGTVRLRSADPMEPPRIQLPGMREASDVDRMAEAYLRAWEVANHPEVRDRCAALPASIDGPASLRSWIRENAYSIPHVVGTCAMGPSSNERAVVDASGRVHGTERFSVIDASIIPEAPSGFPHLSTIMIAERLSEQVARSL